MYIPEEGASYNIREWDDTIDRVRVIRAADGKVLMCYPDGVAHWVSTAYFESIAVMRMD